MHRLCILAFDGKQFVPAAAPLQLFGSGPESPDVSRRRLAGSARQDMRNLVRHPAGNARSCLSNDQDPLNAEYVKILQVGC